MEPIVFDRSKVTYDEYGQVVITEAHASLLRKYLPRLREVLELKWRQALDDWLKNPPLNTDLLRWNVMESYRKKFRDQVEYFLESVFEDGTLHMGMKGYDGFAPSEAMEAHKVLAPALEELILTQLPLEQVFNDLVRLATSPDAESEWEDHYETQIEDARWSMWCYIGDTTGNHEMAGLFYLTHPTRRTEDWLCDPDEFLDPVWDAIIDELPDELKALHVTVWDNSTE